MNIETLAATDLGVLVLAPFGRDAGLVCETLAEVGIRSRPVATVFELIDAIQEPAGAALVAEEALETSTLVELSEALAEQPSWSDFPFIIFTTGSSSTRITDANALMYEPLGNVTLLERPVRTMTLLSAVRSALRARRRQYEVRDHERALFESESRYRCLVTATTNLVWHTNAKGQIDTEVSEWGRFTSQSVSEYQGWGWTDALHPADRERVMASFWDALKKEKPFLGEFRLSNGDGYRRVFGRAVPLYGENGEVQEWIATCTDVEQQRAAEDALIKQEKLAIAGRLATTVAHEINNPLQAAVNLICLVQSSADLDQARQVASSAEAELGRVSEIVTRTLSFYRQPTKAGPADVTEIVESVLALFQPRLDKARIAIEREFENTGPLVCYSGEIRQILANLVANAIDAMPNGGKLRVRLRPGRHWRDASRQGVRITLADSGPGMPKHVRARIFEPFFTTKGAIGNGLGLWVTSELVRKHHGRMNLHTRTSPVHSGTAFSIFFPYQISEDGSVAA